MQSMYVCVASQKWLPVVPNVDSWATKVKLWRYIEDGSEQQHAIGIRTYVTTAQRQSIQVWFSSLTMDRTALLVELVLYVLLISPYFSLQINYQIDT